MSVPLPRCRCDSILCHDVHGRTCDTLIRVHSIVEYLHDDSCKVALLRISVGHKDGRPTLSQLSCQVAENEEASEIHGSDIERKDVTEFLQKENRCPK